MDVHLLGERGAGWLPYHTLWAAALPVLCRPCPPGGDEVAEMDENGRLRLLLRQKGYIVE